MTAQTDMTEKEKNDLFERASEFARYGITRSDLTAMGETTVRRDLNDGKWGCQGAPAFGFVANWLEETRLEREQDSLAKREAREEATLSIAKEANRFASDANKEARRANRLALIAITITIISSMIIANLDSIGRLLILWFP
jgi:hypothetical protein